MRNTFDMNTAIGKVFNALVVEGRELTAKQISTLYNVSNPHDIVYNLRMEGFSIYLNNRRDTKGRRTQKYRFGNPSRKLIAAGYKAMAAGIA